METRSWQGAKTRTYSCRMGNIADSRLMNGDNLCQIGMERQRGDSSLLLGRNDWGRLSVHIRDKTQKEGYIQFYILVLCAWLIQPQLYQTWENP